MFRSAMVLGVILSAATGFISPLADAGPLNAAASKPSNFMRIHGTAQAPYGFVRFCEANEHHCKRKTKFKGRFNATPERLVELDRVNRFVNDRIKPRTDTEIYGVSEYWTLPSTVGDCEDYALLKRQLLVERGWPPSSLLMTVVRDEVGDGHAILTARTAQGDFVLDNKIADVRIWNATPYEFVMRQSYVNPMTWVSLDAAYSDAPIEMAGAPRE
ncbi:MAG: transglutaminase-like cysteine peptidase [Pseudomonadota bacterium]